MPATHYHFASKAEAVASTDLGSALECTIDGFRYEFTASQPSHVAKFQNTASARWFVYSEPVFWQTAIDHPDICNLNHNDAADASFKLVIPLQISSGSTAILTIDPEASKEVNTDAARWAVVDKAIAWASRCIVSNESLPEILIAGSSNINVVGQSTIGNYALTGHVGTPVKITMAPAEELTITNIQFETIVAGQNVNPKAKYGGVTHIDVTNGGTGYVTAPTVTIAPGTVNASATAYVANGVVTGVVVTNRGTGYLETNPPSVTFSGGGGTGAAGVAHVNGHIVSVTVTVSSALPNQMRIGGPIGCFNVVGDNDAGAINGAYIVTNWDINTKRVSFDINCPAGTPVNPTVINSGELAIPTVWLQCRGGFTGGGLEGMLNVGRGAELITESLHTVWDPSSQTQALKSAQKCISTGILAARYHNIRGRSVMAGWPGGVIRLALSGGAYLNQMDLGAAPYGGSIFTLQNGGWTQIAASSIGGSKGEGIVSGQGCLVLASGVYVGACDVGFYAPGGRISCPATFTSSCRLGLSATLCGTIESAAGSDVKRCDHGVWWDSGGTVLIPETDIVSSLTAKGRDIANTERYGGRWISSVSQTQMVRTMIINTGAKAGATAGWIVGGGAVNTGLMATLPASKTGATLVVPIPWLRENEVIKAFHLIGQIESAGNTVTLNATLRRHEAAAADPTDTSIASITTINVTGDTKLDNTNAKKDLLTEVVEQDRTYYLLITGTTAAATDIALLGVGLTLGI